MKTFDANFRTRIVANHCVYIDRFLTKDCQILVTKNQEVSPNEAIFLSRIPQVLWGISLSYKLKVHANNVSKYLKKSVGEMVLSGEVIATRTHLLSNIEIKAPQSGVIHSFDAKTGRLVIKTPIIEVPILSGVYGSIHKIDKDQKLIKIKTMASEILGVFGRGNPVGGKLRQITNKSQINENIRGLIIFSNLTFSKSDLSKLQSFGVAGMIVGGLNYDQISASAMPIILTEGFGDLNIGEDILDKLLKSQERFIYMEAENLKVVLPEDDAGVILTVRKIGLPENRQDKNLPPLKLKTIKKGDNVRLVSDDLLGKQGQIVSIDQTETRLESGIKVICVMIDCAGKKIKVPVNNIELI